MKRLKQMTNEEYYNYLKERFIKKYKRNQRSIKRKISKYKETFKISQYVTNYDKEYRNNNKIFCLKFTRDGIKVVCLLKEFWNDIKNYIPKTITSLEVPFELIKDDINYLNNFLNLKYLTINDELNEENIKLLYDNTNIREIYTKDLNDYYRYYYKKDFSVAKMDFKVILVTYKDLIIKNKNYISKNKNMIDKFLFYKEIIEDKILTIETYDLEENRIKKILDLIDINCLSKIIIDVYSKNYFGTDFSYFNDVAQKKDLRFRYNGHTETDIESFKNYTESLKWYKEIINESNLSPVEKVMFAYDIMKSFEYKENIKDKKASRQPHKVIESGDIVCVGYCELLKEILNDIDENIKVGDFATFCYDKDDKPLGGHERNIIQIDDEKYDIHGIFTLDVTWDSVKNSEQENLDNNYTALDLYRYFLIPTCDYIKIFPYDNIPMILCKYLNIPHKNDKKYSYVDCYNIYFNEDLKSKKITEEKTKEYLGAKELPKKVFNEILYNVRLAEGYSHEQALKEVEKVNRINNKIINIENEENTLTIEKKLTKKKEI